MEALIGHNFGQPALRMQLYSLPQHPVSCGGHSKLGPLTLRLTSVLSWFNLHPKQLCASGPPRARGSHGQTPPRAGPHLDRAQHTGTVHGTLIAECPQASSRSELALSTSEQDLDQQTATPGQVSDPGLHSVWPPSGRPSRSFDCTWDPGSVSTHHPSSP